MKTTKYQSFSHWFYYHKLWVILLTIFALMMLTLYWTHHTGPKADYVVSWVGTTLLNEEEEAAMTAAVAACGKDVNQDGSVSVQVVQYEVHFATEGAESSQIEETYSNVVKLIGQLDANECYLYFMEDPEGFQYAVGALRYLSGEPSGEEDHYEYHRWKEMCVPWTCEGLERRSVWLGRRALFREGQEYDVIFPGGEELFEALAYPSQEFQEKES